MNNIIALENVSIAFGLNLLLDHVKLQIHSGERVCLIGRNGAGKSTLLKIMEGTLLPDSGYVWRKPNLRLARLQQELPQDLTQTVYQYIAGGLSEMGDLLTRYHALTHRLTHSSTQKEMTQLETLQQQIDAMNGWQFEQKIKTILERLDLNADKTMGELSGGWQRRAALGRALVSDPELLLLDEPTNHLDIAMIQWLEDQLISSGVGLIFITHDRTLLKKLATRIIELDRGKLTSWQCDYTTYLQRKADMLQTEAKHNAEFDKKLAQEETWIRQGIKARRTRNEGRVRALEALRLERAKRREVESKATFEINKANQSGHLVVEVQDISHAFNDKQIINHFSIRIMRGDRIGLIGPNGVGKSTLLNILLGNLTPQRGTVTIGTKLQVAYFDQLRQALDPEKTVINNVAEGSDFIEVNGKRQHIISYLSDFLFTPERAQTPVKALSGGECNRLLLAKLFSQPANLLVMDEPTNDLDIETLELLEELLSQYKGSLLLVTHDRTFLDNVVTSTLVFSGNGKITEYIGGYQEKLAQEQIAEAKTTPTKTTQKSITVTKKKLSYKEQKELETLPNEIMSLEKKQLALQDEISHADFYKQNSEKVALTLTELKNLEAQIKERYQRWEDLENQK